MNLDELIKKIKKRPSMFFASKDVGNLKSYLSGFLFCRSHQDDFDESEKHFKHNFSDFIATKKALERGESWDKLLTRCDEPWEAFFEYYEEFTGTD